MYDSSGDSVLIVDSSSSGDAVTIDSWSESNYSDFENELIYYHQLILFILVLWFCCYLLRSTRLWLLDIMKGR